MRRKKVFSVSSAIIMFALLLISTPNGAVSEECAAGSTFSTHVSCSGGCPCPPASGERTGEILSQTGALYDISKTCIWIISSYDAVSIQVSEFVTEFNWDFLYIESCTSSVCDVRTNLATLSGDDYGTLPTYVSTTGYVWFRFFSNYRNARSGFKIQWSVGDSGINHNMCAPCGVGKYKIGPGNAICTDCLSNQFSTAVGAVRDVCEVCPVNSIPSSTQNSCNCNAGSTGPNEVGQCVQCAAGKYKVGIGDGPCVHCIAGKSSSIVGAQVEYNTCVKCRPGKSTLGLDASAECVDCVPGKYATDFGYAQCQLCSPGKYIWLSAYTKTCYPCLANTYSTEWAAIEQGVCIACPANSASPSASDAKTDCKCNAGWTESEGSCVKCDAGKYKNVVGNGVCVDCVAGTYSTSLGANIITVCRSCVAGKYSTQIGAVSDICQTCPENSASPSASDAKTDCKCNAGWTESTGSCVQCGAGKYKDVIGNEACVDCVAGTYSTNLGANIITVCTACAAGEYSTQIGAMSDICQTCPANSFSPAASDEATDCKCNAGWTESTGSCVECGVGKYKNAMGNEACVDCVPGKYST